LRKLLSDRRGVRNRKRLPNLSEEQILSWADAHHARTGTWPTRESGPILEAPGETWAAVDSALRNRLRGLPGGSSLALLLSRERGVRNHLSLPKLLIETILTWADAWQERTGTWPNMESGPVPGTSETWMAIDQALKKGGRGLPGGSSLAKLLAAERGVRNVSDLPRLSRPRILSWA
jgi:hypothetical protein